MQLKNRAMIELGKVNTLQVVRKNRDEFELSDEEGTIVYYPIYQKDVTFQIEDSIDVFVFKDSRGDLVASQTLPLAKRGEFGYLKTNEVNDFGAFMDWGLEKDLFVPFSEQSSRMTPGRKYLVYIFLDEKSNRLAGSTKVHKFFEKEDISVSKGDEVDLLVYEFTDIGMNAVVNNLHTGLLYSNETYKHVKPGDKLKGYIKNIREDNKIDISLQIQGYKNVEPNAQKILTELKNNNGYLDLNDKSDPMDISFALEMSKKTFKKSIGSLYKQKLIRIEEDGIYLITDSQEV